MPLPLVVGGQDLVFELARRTGDQMVLSGHGLYVKIERQVGDEEGRHQRTYVQVDIQGAVLSGSRTGLDVIEAYRSAVEGFLWPELTREELAPVTMPGRQDVAIDIATIAVHAPDAEAYLDREVFAHTNLDAARANWRTHARGASVDASTRDAPEQQADDHSQMRGDSRGGRTFYMGRATSKLRVYERSKHTKDGHWEVLSPTLVKCGWDATSPLTRAEVQLNRDWFRDQVFELPDGRKVRGDMLTFDQWCSFLPVVIAKLCDRFRHVEHIVGPRGGAYYADSPWWLAARGAGAWFEENATRRDRFVVPKLVAKRREARVDAARERAARAVIVLRRAGGPDGAQISMSEALQQVVERVDQLREKRFEEAERFLKRVEYRLALPRSHAARTQAIAHDRAVEGALHMLARNARYARGVSAAA